MTSVVAAATKTSFASKINWTQAVGGLAIALAMFGVDMPEDVRAAVVSGIASATQIATWVMRTWFTTKVTAASVG